MDWRHPDCHAIYWAVKALNIAIQNQDRDLTTHESNTDRIVAHSLQNLFRYGKISIMQGPMEQTVDEDPDATPMWRRDIFLAPDLRMFRSYNNASVAILEKYKDDRGRLEALKNGHRNMLRNALLSFYQAGLRREALDIFNELRRRYPLREFDVSLEQYARSRFLEELESIGILDAREQIVTILMDSYYLFATGNDDAAAGRERLAQQIHEFYFSKYSDNDRIDLPSMRVLRYIALVQVINTDAYPLYVREGLMRRIQVERPDLYEQLEQTAEEARRRIEEQQEAQ
jgi:hypothetical protein